MGRESPTGLLKYFMLFCVILFSFWTAYIYIYILYTCRLYMSFYKAKNVIASCVEQILPSKMKIT